MFSIKESLKYAWAKCKEHMELVLFSTLLLLAVGWLSGGLSPIGLIGVIFMIIVRIGYTKIFLRIYDGESPKFSEIFEEYRTFWRYLGVSILLLLTVLGGLILLIIPGLIWAVRFSFAPMIVIDDKIGPMAAMKESWAITKGNFWKITLFYLTLAGINILGALVFWVGLIVSVPVSVLASVYVYRTLSQKKAGLITPSPQQA